MNRYRIEFAGDHYFDGPLTIMVMDRPCFTNREFRILKRECQCLAADITEGYCRATVFLNGRKVFRYTFIKEEPSFVGAMTTRIWSAWPDGNYRTMRIARGYEQWAQYTSPSTSCS